MNFKRLIITSLVGSIGIAVLSLSLSIAWYNTSENLYLDTLVISVSGEQQLFISTTGEEGSFVTDLRYTIEDDDEDDLQASGLFQPVSSMFKSNWLEDDLKTEPELYVYNNSVVAADYAPRAEQASWGYYHQHLYLYCDADVNATLDSESLIFTQIDRLNEKRIDELMNDNEVISKYGDQYTSEEIRADLRQKLNKMKECMRVGLLDVSENIFYIVDPYKNGDTLLGGRADLFASTYYDYHLEGVEYYETIYGEVTGRENAVYQNTRDTDTDEPSEYTSFASRTKAGVHAFDLEQSLDSGLVIKKEDSLALNQVEENLILPLEGGKPKEIVLLIYMEGWDLDCVNSHMGGSFNVDMKFKISEEIQ